jgi:aspartate aminotransferase-like enzyme
MVRRGMAEMGFDLFPDPAWASPLVSAFRTRPDVNTVDLGRILAQQHGIIISGALDELFGKVFRIGHMGKARSPEYSEALLAATRAALETMGVPIPA